MSNRTGKGFQLPITPIYVAVVAVAVIVVCVAPWQGMRCEAGGSAERLATYEQRTASHPTTEALWRRIPDNVVQEQTTTGTICPSCPPGNVTGDVEYQRTFIAEAIHNKDAATTLQLTTAEPPDDTHAMTRGLGFTIGALQEADFITSTIETSAAEDFEASTRSILDFGGSSGRVVRVLKAAFPSNKYALCDPNPKSIAWAKEHFPGVHAFVSPGAPPLPLPAKSLDLIYAVSIWSHYAERLALLWLNEMHRLLKPKGLLYITTHGFQSLRYYSKENKLPVSYIKEMQDDLKTKGHHFDDLFGPKGDWGVVNSEWGYAYLSPAWMERSIKGKFETMHLCLGCEQDNQDIWVLRRV